MLFSLTGRSSTAACLCTISTNRSNGYSRFRAAMVAWHSGPQAAIVHPARCCGGTASAKCWVRSVTKMASRS